MPDASIKGIDLEIKASAKGASAEIDRLTGKLNKLNSAMGGTGAVKEFSKSMSELGKAKSTSGALSTFQKTLANVKSFKAFTARIKESTGALSKLGAAFKRIVFYRFIRSVIREIGDAFKYGVNNLYAWSQAADGRFAASMDTISTAFAYFKNSIGAAVAPLINALAPAIDYVIDKAVALLNVINQLFARLTGATYWTKAIKQANAYGDAASSAGGAAKEALRYLAPFDELNVLPSDNGGGGGGGGGGSSGGGLFEIQQDFSESISNFADMVKAAWNSGDWEEVGRFLGGKVNDLINNLPWATMGANVGKFINALFGTTYWTLEEINFTNLGSKIAEFVNNALENINFDVAGRLSVRSLTAVLDTIIGFLEGLDWGLVASSVSDFIVGAFNEFNDWLDDTDWTQFGNSLYQGIKDAITNIKWNEIAQSFAKMVAKFLVATAEIGVGFAKGAWDDLKTEWNNRLAEYDGNVIRAALSIELDIASGFGSINDWIYTNIKQPLWEALAEGFGVDTSSIANGVVEDFIQNFGDTFAKQIPVIGNLIQVSEIFSGIREKVNGGIEPIKAIFDDWMEYLRGLWSDVQQIGVDIQNFIAGLWNSIVDSISTTKVGETLTAVFNIDWDNLKIDPITIEATADITDTHQSGKFDVDSNANMTSWNPAFGQNTPWAYTSAYFNWWDKGDNGMAGRNKFGTPWAYTDAYFNWWDKGKNGFSYKNGLGKPWAYTDAYFNWWDKGDNGMAGRNKFGTPWAYTDAYFKWWYNWLSSPWSYASAYFNWYEGSSTGIQGKNGFGTPWSYAQAYFSDYNSGTLQSYYNPWAWAYGYVYFNAYKTANQGYVQLATGGAFYGGSWHDIPQYAGGTTNAHGSLFVAGEAGPEVVGHIGGRTEVLNQSQLASTMYAAVKNAMSGIRFKVSGEAQTYDATPNNEDNMVRAIITALQTLGLTGDALDNIEAHISSQEVYDSVRESNRRNTRMTGVNAFA